MTRRQPWITVQAYERSQVASQRAYWLAVLYAVVSIIASVASIVAHAEQASTLRWVYFAIAIMMIGVSVMYRGYWKRWRW